MSEPEIHITCRICGLEFVEKPMGDVCQRCKGNKLHAHIIKRDEIALRETRKLQADHPDYQGHVREIVSREKKSRNGLEAKEIIDIDRSHPKKTTKYHEVKEFNGHEWQVVHKHQEEYKAKRRPKN